MAKYMLLIQGDSESWADIEPKERARIEEGHRRFAAAAGPAIVGGHELASASTATTLRSSGGGRPDITDGPFLETKEIVGGFYVIDVPDLDEAIRLASLLPETAASYTAGVEIRPVIEPA
jgi:hypothetical protein